MPVRGHSNIVDVGLGRQEYECFVFSSFQAFQAFNNATESSFWDKEYVNMPKELEGRTGNEMGRDGGTELASTAGGRWIPWGSPRNHMKSPSGLPTCGEKWELLSVPAAPYGALTLLHFWFYMWECLESSWGAPAATNTEQPCGQWEDMEPAVRWCPHEHGWWCSTDPAAVPGGRARWGWGNPMYCVGWVWSSSNGS